MKTSTLREPRGSPRLTLPTREKNVSVLTFSRSLMATVIRPTFIRFDTPTSPDWHARGQRRRSPKPLPGIRRSRSRWIATRTSGSPINGRRSTRCPVSPNRAIQRHSSRLQQGRTAQFHLIHTPGAQHRRNNLDAEKVRLTRKRAEATRCASRAQLFRKVVKTRENAPVCRIHQACAQ